MDRRQFLIASPAVLLPALPDAQLLAGRESQPPVLDWSGLEYSFGPGFAGESYEITIQEAR